MTLIQDTATRICWRSWAFVVLLLALLGATNHWLPWQQSIETSQATDVLLYEQIANASPAFPVAKITHHHAQRFAVHYLTGALSKATGSTLPDSYRLMWALLTLAIVVLTDRLLRSFRLSEPAHLTCMAVFFANPYALRFYALAFGMLQDLVFVLGGIMLVFGLHRRRLGVVLIGVAVAALGRQTAIMLIPGLALWMIACGPWRELPMKRRLAWAGLTCATIVSIYIGTGLVAASFSHPSENVGVMLGLFRWLGSPEFRVPILMELFARLLIPFVISTGLFFGMGDVKTWRTPESLACLLMAAGISAQPLLSGPRLTGQNGSRLSALGLIFVVLVLARGFENSGVFKRPFVFAAVIITVFLSSFHHLYSIVGPSGPEWFAAVQCALTAGILILGTTLRFMRQITAQRALG